MLLQANLSGEEIELFSQKLCNSIGYDNIIQEDVFSLLHSLPDLDSSDWGSRWPRWEKLHYLLVRFAIARRSEATVKLAPPKGGYEPMTLAQEDAETRERAAKLQRILDARPKRRRDELPCPGGCGRRVGRF